MALSLAYFQNAFKNFGKLITAANMSVAQVAAFDALAMASVAQAVSGVAAEYNTFHQVMKPFADSVNGTVSSLGTVQNAALSACDNYMKKILAVDLGLATNATTAQIAAALATQASGAGAFLQASGAHDATNSFAVWFYNAYGVRLYQDATPTVLDAWITATVQSHS